jgi:multiple sugar transport system substrate-binding protein
LTRHHRYLAAAVILLVVAAACAPPGAAPGTTAPGVEGTAAAGDVVFWTSHTDVAYTGLESIVEAFNALGGTQVQIVQVPGAETEATRLITAVRGGTGPDVYMLDRFTVAQRAADGLITDLSQFDPNALEGHVDFAADEATFDDKPYALPFDTDTRALYYNKGMLEEAGIDVAELDPANGPITWDRLKEIAFQLNEEEGGNYTRVGFIPWQHFAQGQGWHYTFGFSWGADFFDEQACQVTPTDPNNVEAFQWVYDYAQEMDVAKTQAFLTPFLAANLPPQQEPFNTEQVAFLITGDWNIANLAQYVPDMDYGITYLPVPEAGMESTTWAGGWSLVVPQGARNAAGGFEFMNWAAGEEGQRIYVQETSHLPTIEGLGAEEGLLGEEHAFFASLLPQAQNRPPLPVGALYWDELTTAWEATYRNEAQPQDSLQRVSERVQPQMDQFCP